MNRKNVMQATVLLVCLAAFGYGLLADNKSVGSLGFVFILGFTAAKMMMEKGESDSGVRKRNEQVIALSSSNIITLVLVGIAIGVATGYVIKDLIQVRPAFISLAAVIFLAFTAAGLIGEKNRRNRNS